MVVTLLVYFGRYILYYNSLVSAERFIRLVMYTVGSSANNMLIVEVLWSFIGVVSQSFEGIKFWIKLSKATKEQWNKVNVESGDCCEHLVSNKVLQYDWNLMRI